MGLRRGFIQAGYVDPNNLLFARERIKQVREVVRSKAEALSAVDDQYAQVFRQHPFHEPVDLVPVLRQLLDGPEFRRAIDLP